MTGKEFIQCSNRRAIFKLTGFGLLGGLIGSTLSNRRANAVTLAHASWIHGHSMQIEYPDKITSEWRAGFFIRLDGRPGSQNWFHFAVPTPVIVSGRRLKVGSVMLRFRTGSNDAFVRDVHVYDGERKIAQHNEINLHGDNLFKRFDVPGNPPVQWGLGISIGVGFGVEPSSHRMEFISAGCDFIA